MLKFHHLCLLPTIINLLVHVLYHTAYHSYPNLQGQKPPNQIWKETQHCKYKQTITFLCPFIWKCKWKSGCARATTIQLTVMLSWMVILASVKLIKIYLLAERWHFIIDPLVTGASLMGGCGITQILCGSSDQPLSANFIFLAYSRKDYAIMLLFFYSLSFFFPSCCFLARVSLWSHCRNSGKMHCGLITHSLKDSGNWSNFFLYVFFST